MTAPDLSILDGLTDAQKAFVASITFDGWWRTDEDTPRGLVGPLAIKGILESQSGLGGKIYRLPPLGQQIRTALLETEK